MCELPGRWLMIEIWGNRSSQFRLRFPFSCFVAKPPNSSFFDSPFVFFPGKQQGSRLAEGGLVADDEDGVGTLWFFRAIRPADGSEQAGDVAVGVEALIGFEGQAKGLGSFLAAYGGANENAQFLGSVLEQPVGHLPGLLFAASGEPALLVRVAVFGVGVAP